MQFILSKEELEKGSQLTYSFTTEELTIDNVYEKQESLNNQGYFTVIRDIGCAKESELAFTIDVYTRSSPLIEIG